MTTLQTLTRRTIAINYTTAKKHPQKIGGILKELGLTEKGNSTSHLSEDHDKVLY